MQEAPVSNEMRIFRLWTFPLFVIGAIVRSEYQANHIGTWIAICAGGFEYSFIGFTFAGKGALAKPQLTYKFAERSRELCFREFYSTGYWFQPYGQTTSIDRKQFRSSSTPQISPDRDWAFFA